MDAYTLLSTFVAGLLLFLAIAFFKREHMTKIDSLSTKLRILNDGKVKLEIENRELVQKLTDLQGINIEQQAKIAEYEDQQAFLKKYPIDKITRLPRDSTNGNFICPICLQESPPRVVILQEDERQWWCPKDTVDHFSQWKSQKLS